MDKEPKYQARDLMSPLRDLLRLLEEHFLLYISKTSIKYEKS